MILGVAYAPHRPMPDMWEAERQNRFFTYLSEKIKMEQQFNPHPTDEGYQKLLIEVAESCCNQYQRKELVKLLGFTEQQMEDEDE